ncbi:MAG: PIN domain-containing protein [Chloroflexi bacterium]|jgi:PIN domain nuclease of toxin-antitoxin system|nr:PIN domain-containing protein [Chloroflexota bacterium]
MNTYVTDTHALLWHLAQDPALSAPAADLFRQADTGSTEIIIPSIVLVEIVYLCERQRVPRDRVDRVMALPGMPGSRYRVTPLDESVVQMLRRIPRDQVSDMPDRIIGATALYLDLPLITRDKKLLGSKLLACVW